jgi:phosphohistidine phosphatase
MRHGEASFDAKQDDDRELTENGRARIRHHIALKQDELASVRLFLSSPIRRAQQTAKLAHVLLRRQDAIETVDWLRHESKPHQAIEELSRYTVTSVMLFSHQPFASHFAELLCGEETGSMTLNTASIIAMDADPVVAGFGKILWQLS